MDHQNTYDEISLVELVVMWIKGWKPAALCALLAFLLGAFVINMLPNKYESQVQLIIGGLDEDKLFVQPQALVAQLKAKYRVGDNTQGARPLPRLESVAVGKNAKSAILTFKAKAYTAEEAASYLAAVLAQIEDNHNVSYDQAASDKRLAITQTQAYLEDIKNGKVTAQDANVSDVIKNINELQQELAAIKPTTVLAKPSLPVKPTSPKKPLLFAVLVVMSLAVLFILPFLLQFVSSIKAELNKQVGQ